VKSSAETLRFIAQESCALSRQEFPRLKFDIGVNRNFFLPISMLLSGSLPSGARAGRRIAGNAGMQ